MKKLLNMILIIALLIGLGALFQGCMLFSGHGDDADPFEQGEGELQNWDDVFGQDEPPPAGIQARTAAEDTAEDSMQTTREILNSMGYQVPGISLSTSKIVNTSKFSSYSTYSHANINLNKTDSDGGRGSVVGEAVIIKEKYGHCVLFADLAVDYTSYTHLQSGTTISGTGNAKIIATSYDCDYHSNMHVDLTMLGNFSVNLVTLRELEFSADYNSAGGTITIVNSAIADTEEGLKYCYHGPVDKTECTTLDGRPFENFCASDDDICQVSAAGHESCAADMPTGNEGHCNLGCCDELPAQENTCNDTWTNRRECDATTDVFYTQDYNHKGSVVYTYEVKLVCTPDGLWSLPCLPGSADNICPFGSTCVDSDDVDWGTGLTDYGYCSCLGE